MLDDYGDFTAKRRVNQKDLGSSAELPKKKAAVSQYKATNRPETMKEIAVQNVKDPAYKAAQMWKSDFDPIRDKERIAMCRKYLIKSLEALDVLEEIVDREED